jgi:hypothetical protein
MRMKCAYEGNNNGIASLEVDHRIEGQWQALDLGIASSGFEIFVYSLFTCQHMYFRVNCAERDLLLDTAEGSIAIGTDQDWSIETVRVHFSGRLGSGRASPEDIDYIVSRMKQCPVSRNLLETLDTESTVILD